MQIYRTLIAATTTVMLAGVANAQQPLLTRVDRSGLAVIRQSDGAPPLANITVGLYEAGWQLRLATPGTDAGNIVITCPSADAIVTGDVTYKVSEADPETLVVTANLTPNKNIKLNSVHIAASLPVSDWQRGRATQGETSVIVSDASDSPLLIPSAKGTLRLTRQGNNLEASSANPVLLQDNRKFGTTALEIRAGNQYPDGAIWRAGETRSINLMLRLYKPIRILQERPLTIEAGEDWAPISISNDVTAGSALDFRTILPPLESAGTRRLTVTPSGNLTIDGKTPIRLFGTNLCFDANYLEKPDVDRLVRMLAATGYNALRIHHYDNLLDVDGYIERLDYLVATCRKAGILVKTDLYVSRDVPGYKMDEAKAAILLRPEAMEDWKAFSRKLLTHVNPYTGLAWKDDPSIAIISVINEPNLTNVLGRLPSPLQADLQKAWDAWRVTRNLPATPLPQSVDNGSSGRELGAFLADLHARAYASMAAFLKKDLGVKALLTDLNGWSEVPAFQNTRLGLDVVDAHFYFDHPNFPGEPWKLPSTGANGGNSSIYGGGAGPVSVAPQRLLDKPFIVSEWNFAAPNQYRYEAGLLTAATASIQGWDGMFRFAWAHSRATVNTPKVITYFDTASDPTALASERIAALMYRSGALKTSPVTVARIVPQKSLVSDFTTPLPPVFPALALVARIGMRIDTGKLPVANPKELRLENSGDSNAIASMLRAELLPPTNKTSLDTEFRQSITNQVFLDGTAGSLRLIAPNAVAGVGAEGDVLKFGSVDVDIEGTGAATAVASLDKKTISTSQRLLLIHATDTQNAGTRYFSSDRQTLENFGGDVILARQGKATFSITRASIPKAVTVYRLDASGNRLDKLGVTLDENVIHVECQITPEGKPTTFYYEVLIEDPKPVAKPVSKAKPSGNKPSRK